MTVDYYRNTKTGEMTRERRKAFEWLRAGDDVDVVATNGREIRWIAFVK